MKMLDRYVVRSFLVSVLLCSVGLMSLRLVSDLFFNMDEFTKRGKDEEKTFVLVVEEIGTYYGYHSLEYFRQLGGVIIVTAAAFTLARMNRTNELTAMLASGVSLHRVLLPVGLCAVAMNVLILVDSEALIPRFKHRLVRSRDDVAGIDTFPIRAVTDHNKSSWYSRRFSPAEQRVVNPLIILRDEQYAHVGHLSGPEARYDPAEKGWVLAPAPGAGRTARQAVLHVPGAKKEPTTAFVPTVAGPEAFLQRAREEPKNRNIDWAGARSVSFLEIEDPRAALRIEAGKLDLAHVGGEVVGTVLHDARFTYHRGRRELAGFVAARATYGQLDKHPGWLLEGGRLVYRCDLTPSDLALRQSGEFLKYLSTAELTRLIRGQDVSDPQEARLTRHARFADFFNNLIMLLVAGPFILSRERNIKSSAALTVLAVGGLYVFIYLSRYVGLQPTLAAWMPILVFGPVAALALDSVKT